LEETGEVVGELPEDPPGQAELLACLARETRARLRLDCLWVLVVALPLKGAILGQALRPGTSGRVRAALIAVGAVTSETLRYMLRRK